MASVAGRLVLPAGVARTASNHDVSAYLTGKKGPAGASPLCRLNKRLFNLASTRGGRGP